MNNKIKNLVNTVNIPDDQKKQAEKILSDYWDLIGNDLKQLVKSAHSKPKIYQNNYGYYLGLLTQLKESGIYTSTSAMLLILAGADVDGIKAAVKIIKG